LKPRSFVPAIVVIGLLSYPATARCQIAGTYDGELFADMSGGVRRGTTYLGNLNVQVTLDMQHLAGWHGATIFVDGLGVHGGQPSEFAGDAQGVSNIEAPHQWTIEEAWIEQNLFANRFSILLGRYDLSSEFDHVHSADLFLNSSFGIGPEFSQSGVAGPSIFPDTSVGARFAFKPFDGLVLRTAVLDGVPVERPTGREIFAKGDGVLIVSEAAFLKRPLPAGEPRYSARRLRLGRQAQLPPYDQKIAVGIWHYTAHNGSSGAYVIGDAIIYKDSAGRQLRAFGQIGAGDGRTNRFESYTGAGVALSGLVSSRKNDEIGFGIAAAHNGSHFEELQREAGQRVEGSEVALELAYRLAWNARFAVQPDLQYVIDPNTDPNVRNAFVALLRVEIGF
jgi:porin